MLGPLLGPDLQELIQEKNWDVLRDSLSHFDPPDIAEILGVIPDRDDVALFRLLPRDLAGQVFSYLPIEQQEPLLRSLTNDQMRGVLAGMTPDDQARLLEELPDEVTRRLLETLAPQELRAARDLLGYPPQSAGRFMTPRYVALRPDMTAREALEHVRRTGRGKETLNILYILDTHGKLLEELRLGQLVLAEPETKVVDIEERSAVWIPATADREEVLRAFEKYDRAALPVVDRNCHMLGIITADDVLDVAEEEATEDIQKIGGMEALDAPYFDVGFWSMVKKRGGWLAALFLGEMLTATAMGYFEGEIEKAAVVALFVPLIISSGGNSGSQGTSLIIRSLALKEIWLKDWWRVFGRELRTGMALGLFLGIIGFCRIATWQGLSQVPHVGTFFQTHSSEDASRIPDGMKHVDADMELESPLAVNAFTLPAGAWVSKGTLLPEDTPLPPDLRVSERAIGHASAYGPHWFLVGVTVFGALIGVVTWGALAGSMLPFVLRRLGFDPATSSAPFVATLVDVTGLVIYFTVAMIVLRGTLL